MTTKISSLPVASSMGVTDLIPIVQGGVTKSATPSLIPFAPSGGSVTTMALLLQRLSRKGFGIVIDGGGSEITAGVKGFIPVPYTGVIKQWTVLADRSGSIVIDIWKDTYANSLPTVADTVAGSEKPTLASAQKNQDTSLTTWTTAVTAGDVFLFNVDSASIVRLVTVFIEMDLT